MKLTEEQQTAVDEPGNVLLQACPGSGKTRTIVARLVREVEQIRDTPFRVACITYTNAAVNELQGRLSIYLNAEDEPLYTISTIHAFCLNEILRPFAASVPGFNGSMQVLTRDRPEFQQIADYAADQVGWHNLNFWDYEDFGSLNLDAEGNLTGNATEKDPLSSAVPFFWQRCAALGFVDFANIIYKSYCLLRDNPEIAASVATRFKCFLIDEFQDTTELQIELLKLIHAQGKSRFFLVGDPAQSIFGFSGARPELIMPFAKAIGARSDLQLSANYRSNPQIVGHANLLFPRDPEMTSEGEWRMCGQEPLFSWTSNTFTTLMEEFFPLAARLEIGYGDTAILTRNWSAFFVIARLLREAGIPVVGPGARPYRRSRLFASIAEQLCGAVVDGDEYDMRNLDRAIGNALQDATGDRAQDATRFERRLILVRLMCQSAALAEHMGASDWLDAMSQTTAEILLEAGWIGRQQVPLFRNSVDEMKIDIRSNKVDLQNLTIQDLGMFASPRRAVRLLTIHNAKGHEFLAVAIIGARQGTLPDYRAKDDDAIEAEKRLLRRGNARQAASLLRL